MTANRARNDEGRPEQARPRDRTGRPLPYGSRDVDTTQEHNPDTVADALALGRQLWNERRFFEAHECLESVWHAVDPPDQPLWQGVIQIAVAGVHLQRGNPDGARTLLHRAQRKLGQFRDGRHGIAVSAALAAIDRVMAALPDVGASLQAIPDFPEVADGASVPDSLARLDPVTARSAQRATLGAPDPKGTT